MQNMKTVPDFYNFGDKIFTICEKTKEEIFYLGQRVQLAFNAFFYIYNSSQSSDVEQFEISFPVGKNPDDTPMLGNRIFSKEDYLKHYQDLAEIDLMLTSIYSLVTFMESMFFEILRDVCSQFPGKISFEKQLKWKDVIDSDSIEYLKRDFIDQYLNSLFYKSPQDFSVDFEKLCGVKLLEMPSFHKYIEIKATRDIFIHNKGIANSSYERKAGTFVRAKTGQDLPVNTNYFLHSYESCLQICEMLQEKFHLIWPSILFQQFLDKKKHHSWKEPSENQDTVPPEIENLDKSGEIEGKMSE